jgi:DNA-binding MarR family transcriptional regulator
MANNQFKRGELYSVINAMAAAAIARRMQKNFRASGLEITIEQWSILYHLWKEDGQNQQQLCDKTFRDKPSITRLLHNLEKQGLVERRASETDKRVNYIFLSATAKDLQNQTIEIANQTMDEALVSITKDEIETVKNVLQKVYDNLTI